MITHKTFKDLYDQVPIHDEETLLKLTEDELDDYQELLKAKISFNKYNKILYFKPDDWFMSIADKMKDNAVCGVLAGNRMGKSYSSTWLYASHLTGIYPEGFTGYKFNEGIDTWVMTSTAEQYVQAGGLQEYLFGPLNDIGTGWIPKDRISKVEMGIGVKGFIKRAYIKHINDKGEESISTIDFKSYSQGQGVMMGASISFALIDEESPMDVFAQVITRTATPKTGNGTGRVLVSMTPEKGLTELVLAFREGHYQGGYVQGTVKDASHITETDIEDMKRRYPKHQWNMRLYGEPMLGQGIVFPFELNQITHSHLGMKVLPHWRIIAALDLGINDPTSISIIAKDPETQRLYVIDEFYKKDTYHPEIASWIKQRYPSIPVVLPHDGFNRTQNAGGTTSYQLFEKENLNLVFERFSNPPEPNGKKNNHIEPGLSFIREKMRIGEFKILDNCENHIKEVVTYAYGSNGKPLPIQRDHAMDSMRYATMMLDRFGMEARQCLGNSGWSDWDSNDTGLDFTYL